MKKIVYLLICCITLFSCKKDEFVQPDYLIFGSIEGNSVSDRYVYYLDKVQLKEDPTVKYFSQKNQNLFTTTLSTDKFLLAKDLLNKIPVPLTETNRNLFIDLNAATPVLWYAEIRLNNRIYSWTFDNANGTTPVYLKSFADEMIRVLGEIR
jgi:hypothetical protein